MKLKYIKTKGYKKCTPTNVSLCKYETHISQFILVFSRLLSSGIVTYDAIPRPTENNVAIYQRLNLAFAHEIFGNFVLLTKGNFSDKADDETFSLSTCITNLNNQMQTSDTKQRTISLNIKHCLFSTMTCQCQIFYFILFFLEGGGGSIHKINARLKLSIVYGRCSIIRSHIASCYSIHVFYKPYLNLLIFLIFNKNI